MVCQKQPRDRMVSGATCCSDVKLMNSLENACDGSYVTRSSNLSLRAYTASRTLHIAAAELSSHTACMRVTNIQQQRARG